MRYRKLGRLGWDVSEIGLGCEGFQEDGGARTQALIDLASSAGVNYIDLYSSSPIIRSSLGNALKGRREQFYLQAHLCSIWRNGQYRCTRKLPEIEESFRDLLLRLNTDYIDVGMIHYVDSVSEWERVERDVLPYAKKLKAEGKIRSIGMSSHNPIAALKAVACGEIDVIMFSVNPCYDLQPASEDCEDLWKDASYEDPLSNMDPDRERLYESCARAGVAISVMKAFGGGDLLSADSPAGVALTPAQCIAYCLDRPAVATVLVGAHSAEELEASLAFEKASAAERDYASAFIRFPRISWAGHCMYCGHCAPCTKGIDIATVTKFLNLARAQKTLPETVREHYAVLPKKASDCIFCGLCETRCPFGVKIKENMKEAIARFGN